MKIMEIHLFILNTDIFFGQQGRATFGVIIISGFLHTEHIFSNSIFAKNNRYLFTIDNSLQHGYLKKGKSDEKDCGQRHPKPCKWDQSNGGCKPGPSEAAYLKLSPSEAEFGFKSPELSRVEFAFRVRQKLPSATPLFLIFEANTS